MPSLANSSTRWARKNKFGWNFYRDVEKPGFLSGDRIFAFGCWIFLNGEDLNDERSAPSLILDDVPIYKLLYESTVDILI